MYSTSQTSMWILPAANKGKRRADDISSAAILGQTLLLYSLHWNISRDIEEPTSLPMLFAGQMPLL